MKKVFLILLFFLISGCSKQLIIKNYSSQMPSYPMFGKIPERSFYYDVVLSDSLKLKWKKSTKGSFANTSVVVEGNYVYVTDLSGNLYCFNADSSENIGTEQGSGEIAIAPILRNGFIYYIVAQSDKPFSKFIYYDIRQGKRSQEIEIPGRVGNEMLRLDDNIFFVSDEGIAYYYSFFLQEKWIVDLNEKVYTSPAASKNKIFIATQNGNLICLNEDDGRIIYKKKLDSRFESAITIYNDIGYIGNDNGNLIAFNINDGSIKWEVKTGAKIKAPAVHNDKYIYAANLAGSLYCFDIETGEKLWSFDSEGIFNTPAALFKNVLVQPDVDEKLLFINLENGKIIKTIEYNTRVKLHPVYFNEMFYVGIDRGVLLAYKCF